MTTANKKIVPTGVDQSDLVELIYYIWTGQASILNYLSTVGGVLSALIASLSAQNGSTSGTVLSVSGKAAFPTSMTAMTGCSISLL
jgi:hypothetical protein